MTEKFRSGVDSFKRIKKENIPEFQSPYCRGTVPCSLFPIPYYITEMTIQPRKRFAQHWLRSDKALNKIVQAAELSDSDRILEIGPGTGILTHRLLPLAASVVAVEIDRDLCQKLVKKIGSVENFLLLQGDILSLDLETNLVQFPTFQNSNKVVANIPYNITGPILEKLLGTIAQPVANTYDLIVLLLQKEVADRICARPDSKAYSSLSVKNSIFSQL